MSRSARAGVRRRSRPSGLSPREVEILRLIARGTEHIYAKTGIGNRVAASRFAAEHGLLMLE